MWTRSGSGLSLRTAVLAMGGGVMMLLLLLMVSALELLLSKLLRRLLVKVWAVLTVLVVGPEFLLFELLVSVLELSVLSGIAVSVLTMLAVLLVLLLVVSSEMMLLFLMLLAVSVSVLRSRLLVLAVFTRPMVLERRYGGEGLGDGDCGELRGADAVSADALWPRRRGLLHLRCQRQAWAMVHE